MQTHQLCAFSSRFRRAAHLSRPFLDAFDLLLADYGLNSAALFGTQQQELIVFIMQMGFISMAISLLMTGCILISVVGGLNDPTTILAIQYTSWASLAAIGLISLMVIVLNIVSIQFNQD